MPDMSMPSPVTSFALLIAVLLLAAEGLSAQDSVFLPLAEQGDGAPSKANRDKTVILTDIKSNTPWFQPVKVLQKAGYREVVSIRPWSAKKAFAALARIKPGAVICVLQPATIDVNFHFDFLTRASRLDQDPFVDFLFGYITGATPEAAASFAASACATRKKKFAKSIFEFGPSTNPQPISSATPHPWAKGFKNRRWAHPQDADDVVTKLAELRPEGILSAWGHGMPDGVDHGMKGAQLAGQKLDLSACVYFSGPCYCGVPAGWFKSNRGKIERVEVAPNESFLLGLLGARVGAVFAGLDPDRGETNHHEREHVLLGASLGAASKATYDDVVIALGKPTLELPHYTVGQRRPHKNVRETMIAGGACRALFGLPDATLFKSGRDNPFAAKPISSAKGILIDWKVDGGLGQYWLPVDIFNGDGGWTHRLRFRCEISLKQARKLQQMEVLEVTKDGQNLPYSNATGAVELFGGSAYLHVTIAFPRKESNRALTGGKKYRARVRFF